MLFPQAIIRTALIVSCLVAISFAHPARIIGGPGEGGETNPHDGSNVMNPPGEGDAPIHHHHRRDLATCTKWSGGKQLHTMRLSNPQNGAVKIQGGWRIDTNALPSSSSPTGRYVYQFRGANGLGSSKGNALLASYVVDPHDEFGSICTVTDRKTVEMTRHVLLYKIY